MSGTRGEIEVFFRTLLLGDFEEEQNTSGQIVGGLISMVPILGQVMSARDLTGAIFLINKRGGFQHADSGQLVNLGFAAFGVIPEIGGAFKTVFKPLWKERRAAKGAVHSGLEAVEGLLGLGKGGAIKWIRQELLGKWVAWTNTAIVQAENALAAAVELTEFIATASGWKDWLIPDPVQDLAKEMLPSLKKLQGQVREPLQRASNEIRAFLEDLLGEQAAAIVMAVGERAAVGSATPAARAHTGNNKADKHPTGHTPERQAPTKVKESDRTSAKKDQGPVHTAVQLTRKAFSDLAIMEKGLVGEHVTDYYELKRLGGAWPHDAKEGSWSPITVKKLNAGKRPINLRLTEMSKVREQGIDAIWQHGTNYTVTEAKARESIAAAYAFGKYQVKKGWIPAISGLTPENELLHYLLSDSGDKQGTAQPTVQMSELWVQSRAKKEALDSTARGAIDRDKCSRRVVLVTFESAGALDHAQALADIHVGKTDADMHPHPDHGITKEWEAAAIDTIVRSRQKTYEMNQVKQEKTSTPDKPQKVKSSKAAKTPKN